MEFILTNERIFLRQVIETVLTSNLPFKETLKKIESIKCPPIRLSSMFYPFMKQSVEKLELNGAYLYRKNKNGQIATLSEAVHLTALKNLGLKNAHVPDVLAFDTNGCIYLSCASGEPIKEFAETAETEDLQEAIQRAGIALGELNTRSKQPLTQSRISFYIKLFDSNYQKLQPLLEERGLTLPYSKEELLNIRDDFLKNPGFLTAAHDDPHFGNILWDPEKKILSFIDIGEIAEDLMEEGIVFSSHPGESLYEIEKSLKSDFPEEDFSLLLDIFETAYLTAFQEDDLKQGMEFVRICKHLQNLKSLICIPEVMVKQGFRENVEEVFGEIELLESLKRRS
jgi:hypothetical protein